MTTPSHVVAGANGLPRRQTGESSISRLNRSNSLGLTRTNSDYAQLSLARMASLETAHPAAHPKEDSDEPEVWSDDKHGRSGDRHDLESGYTVDREGGLPLRQPAHPDIEASANRIAESYLNPGAGSNTIEKEPDGTTELEQRSADSGSGGTDPRGPQSGATTLQDQTNLLPAKQIIVVFLGLSCALFVSLLDQTMYAQRHITFGQEESH
jgi:hypothetical protein